MAEALGLLERDVEWVCTVVPKLKDPELKLCLVAAARMACRARIYYFNNLYWMSLRLVGVLIGTFGAGGTAFVASRSALDKSTAASSGVLVLIFAGAAAVYGGKAANEYYEVVSDRLKSTEKCLGAILSIILDARLSMDGATGELRPGPFQTTHCRRRVVETHLAYPNVLQSVQADQISPLAARALGKERLKDLRNALKELEKCPLGPEDLVLEGSDL